VVVIAVVVMTIAEVVVAAMTTAEVEEAETLPHAVVKIAAMVAVEAALSLH